ncbi:hypothetical protein PHG11b_12 [Flavobacterium phage 11b]|uniref:hypothetical protein n=1 Tax=Flavobacterium phage 11b TaxID=294631 RepID=UPI000044412A|nr:hypothetical protein PHG11b_12 [Flavobacterium phage 11b]CAH56639.1 hypothetical protein PHG11b_12 [Flavobacterium phage 11b]
MKTEFKISREQILKLVHGSTIDNLEEWFPEVFNVELEVGKVYKYKDCLFNYQLGNKCYGFDAYGWVKLRWSWEENYKGIKEATTEEWKYALIDEAKRRGLYYAINFIQAHNLKVSNGISQFHYRISKSEIWTYYGCVFKDGVWAEIIKTFTQEEAEELLGGKII